MALRKPKLPAVLTVVGKGREDLDKEESLVLADLEGAELVLAKTGQEMNLNQSFWIWPELPG